LKIFGRKVMTLFGEVDRRKVGGTQALILGFSFVAWIAPVGTLVAAPQIYDAELLPLGLAAITQARARLSGRDHGFTHPPAVGTLQGWRWL
jgi:hypothetical protein